MNATTFIRLQEDFFFCLLLFLFTSVNLMAEGSKDFREYPGYRLFYNAEQSQQLKVYAAEGETINVGSSHVGISGGFISVYRPDGKFYHLFNGADGLAIINNDQEEINGPTGGGSLNGNGYIPGTIRVGPGMSGIWTIRLEYPSYNTSSFENLLNSAPWDRTDQPVNQRVVLAWDITVTQGDAANDGGQVVEGRVYSNEYISIQNGNNITTSPTFFILTKDGFRYKVDFMETDPWGFPIFSNTTGLINDALQPCYQSAERSSFRKSSDLDSWTDGSKYLYSPQARDRGPLINNKIFFNPPDQTMPSEALVTDLYAGDTHETWLINKMESLDPRFENFEFQGKQGSLSSCNSALVTEVGAGGTISFSVNLSGTAKISLDLNGNAQFDDPEDQILFQAVEPGKNSVVWDGKDGEGKEISAVNGFRINYKLELRGGEIHILMLDVENNPGGISFTRLNGMESPSNEYYYDHSPIGGGVSGNPADGKPRATSVPYTYEAQFGNNRLMDYWSYIEFPVVDNGGFAIDIIPDCNLPILDFDKDLIPDFIDLDDDNDGITDFSEYCNPEGDWVCLPGGLDPSADNDKDNIPNYLDSSDPALDNNCQDVNEDGICDQLNKVYDTDGDGVPDHLDADSDNDGITDLVEAGHQQIDEDGNGVIDGDPSFFGKNGLFNALADEADDFNAYENYTRSDQDKDGIPDHDDLDSDNDGINDVAEAGFGKSDTNDDGRIDDGFGKVPAVSQNGLAPVIDPAITGKPIPGPPDTDFDAVPDFHDLDSDNDGINDVAEALAADPDNNGIIGTGIIQVDMSGRAVSDEEGKVLATISDPTDTDLDLLPDFRDLDADGDGILDVHEADLPDSDKDGILGLGVPIVNEQGQMIEDREGKKYNTLSNPEDTDADQIPDFQDADRDGDGISDQYECPNGWPCRDTDQDLLPDVDDLDSDDDKLLDSEECPGGAPCPDRDTNQLANYLEFDCNSRNTPQPSTTDNTSSFCAGNPVNLKAKGDSTFSERVTLYWTGPNNFETRKNANADDDFSVELTNTKKESAGIYELILETSKGCLSEPLKIFVDLLEKPEAPLLTVEKKEFCFGEDLLLSVNNYTGNEIEYTWYRQTDETPEPVAFTSISSFLIKEAQPASSGIYSVSVEVDGCPSNLSNPELIKVNGPLEIPMATTTSTVIDPVCEGGTVELNVPFQDGATYEWIGPGGFNSKNYHPLIPNATQLINGTYHVQVTLDGCSVRSNDVIVEVQPKPVKPIIAIDNTAPCAGEQAFVNVVNSPYSEIENGLQVAWYNSQTKQVLATTAGISWNLENQYITEGTSVYGIIEMNGCFSDPSDGLSINIQPGLEEVRIKTSSQEDLPVLCEGEGISLSVPAEEGLSYSWYGPSGLIKQSSDHQLVIDAMKSTDSGLYYVVRASGNCTRKTEPINILINKSPVSPELMAENGPVCINGALTLNINNPQELPEGNEVQYSWYRVDQKEPIGSSAQPFYTLPDLTMSDNGLYYVVVTVNDCPSLPSNMHSVQVEEPELELIAIASAGVEQPVCEGGTVSLFLPPLENADYKWFGPNGFSADSANIEISNIAPEYEGEYYAVVTVGSCPITTKRLNIQVDRRPDQPLLTIEENKKCAGEDVLINLQIDSGLPEDAKIEYIWYQSGTDIPMAVTDQPLWQISNLRESDGGEYYAVVSQNGCIGEPSLPVLLEVSTIPGEIAKIQRIPDNACNESSQILEASPPANSTGQWTGSAGLFFADAQNPSTEVRNLREGVNIIYWSLSNEGCKEFSKDSLIIERNTDQLIAADDEFTINFNGVLEAADVVANDQLVGTDQFQLELTNMPENGVLTIENNKVHYQPNQNFFGEDRFEYQLCHSFCPDQCSQAQVIINVVDLASDGTCFAPNVITPNSDGVNDFFKIPCAEAYPQSHLKVFNRWGDLVYSSENYKNDWEGTYQGNTLPNGTYFYIFQAEEVKQPMQGYFTLVR